MYEVTNDHRTTADRLFNFKVNKYFGQIQSLYLIVGEFI